MTEQRIEIGQQWRSRDKRDHGRTVTIVGVNDRINEPGNNGFVIAKSARQSTMRARTLRSRYELVRESTR